MWILGMVVMLSFHSPLHESLKLSLKVPGECVEAGAQFSVAVDIMNSSDQSQTIFPVFIPASGGLTLWYSSEKEVFQVGDIVTELSPPLDHFWQLRPNQYLGEVFEVAAEISKSFLYPYEGLPEGMYKVSARLHVHVKILEESAEEFETLKLLSKEQEFCIAPASSEQIEKNLQGLQSDKLEEVLNALLFFSAVPNGRALEVLQSLHRKPKWQIFSKEIGNALARQKHIVGKEPMVRPGDR